MSYLCYFLENWSENIDFQLIIDVEKVLSHVKKYATKTKINLTKDIAAMIKNMSQKIVSDRLSMQVVLKRVIEKLLGERMMSKKKT